VIATAARLALDPLFGAKYPLATFFVALVFAAWHGGLGPSLVALGISVPAVGFLITEPRGSGHFRDLADQAGFIAYLVYGLGIALMGGSMRGAQLRAEAVSRQLNQRRDELEREEAERDRAEAALSESQHRLQMAIESADMGTWDLDPVGGALDWNDRCRALFGLSPGAPVDYPTFWAGLHPQDRDRVEGEVRGALGSPAGEFASEYRTVGLVDGGERWVAARGRVHFSLDESPSPLSLF